MKSTFTPMPTAPVHDRRLDPDSRPSVVGLLSLWVTIFVCLYSVTLNASELDQLLELPSSDATDQPNQKAEPGFALPVQPQEAPRLDPNVEQKLTMEQVGDLYQQALSEMLLVAQRIGQDRDVSVQTQRQQQAILAKLDQIIEAAQQQNQGGGGGSSGSSTPRPADQTGNPSGQSSKPSAPSGQPGSGSATPGQNEGGENLQPPSDEVVNTGPLEQIRQEWGQLPDRLRGQLLEGISEPFSSIYEQETQRYYRELAREAEK